MRIAGLRPGSMVGVCLAATALLACTVRADEPTASVTLPPLVVPAAPQDIDLEQRVHILEETIRRLSGQFGPSAADPAQCGQSPTWPTAHPARAPGRPGRPAAPGARALRPPARPHGCR